VKRNNLMPYLKYKILSKYQIEIISSFSALISKMESILKTKDFVLKWQEAVLEPSDAEQETGPDISDLMGAVYDELGLPGKIHSDLEDPTWLEYAHKFLAHKFKEFSSDFTAAESEDGKMVGYRCIGVALKPFVEKVKKGEVKSTGIYWAWTEKGADCYWGNKKTEVMLKALIPLSSIDIERTLIQNLSPIHSVETEIRVQEGSPLELVEIKKKGGDPIKLTPTKISASLSARRK